MDAHPSTDYKDLEITGLVGVKRTGDVEHGVYAPICVLILGATGAGKSTFIEALASQGTLGISSNRLDGFTQSVSAYQLQNVTFRSRTIYLVDVPGFADTKISAMSIVSMLKQWMKKNDVFQMFQVFYLTPINVVRLPGSQREVLRLFQALTGIRTARKITIVSTMWDSIWSDSARERAERNFTQLQNDIWKENRDGGTAIVKFMNTGESALSILDNAFGYGTGYILKMESFFRDSPLMQQAPFGSHLYEDLQARISGLKLQRYNIQLEEQEASTSSDKGLMTILRLQLEEVDALLAKFEQELREFGPPPISQTDPVASQSESVPLDVDAFSSLTPPSMTTPVTSSIVPRAGRPTLAAVPTKRGVLSRALHRLTHLGKKED